MDEKRVSFIIAVQDGAEYERCVAALSELIVPEGFEADVVAITEADSIAAAYNEGMASSDARYKVYLRETTLIFHKYFIRDMIRIFDVNIAIGLLGVSGAKKIPTNGICQSTNRRVGKAVDRNSGQAMVWSDVEGLYEKVQALDGCILATQYDIPWREDLFLEDDFYDASQSLEVKRLGYIAAVARQDDPWVAITTDFSINEQDRNVFLDEYSKDIFPLVSILITTYNRPEYFKIALESAIHQTYRNIEIIIGDDSTNNETQKIMGEYLAQYDNIMYIKNEESKRNYQGAVYRGCKNSANIFHKSRGEYINYLNDDDVFHIDKISVMLDCFLEYTNASLVTSYRQAIDKDGNDIPNCIPRIFTANTIISGEETGHQLLMTGNNFIGEPTTVLVKRKYIDTRLGNYAGVGFLGLVDIAQWLESLRYGDLIYLCDTLSYFRMHPGQNQRDEFMHLLCINEHLKYLFTSFEKKLYFRSEEEYKTALRSIINHKLADPDENLGIYQTSKFYNPKIIEEYLRNRGKAQGLLNL